MFKRVWFSSDQKMLSLSFNLEKGPKIFVSISSKGSDGKFDWKNSFQFTASGGMVKMVATQAADVVNQKKPTTETFSYMDSTKTTKTMVFGMMKSSGVFRLLIGGATGNKEPFDFQKIEDVLDFIQCFKSFFEYNLVVSMVLDSLQTADASAAASNTPAKSQSTTPVHPAPATTLSEFDFDSSTPATSNSDAIENLFSETTKDLSSNNPTSVESDLF